MRTKLLVLPLLLPLLLAATAAPAADLRIINTTNQTIRVRFTHTLGWRERTVGGKRSIRMDDLKFHGNRTLYGWDLNGNRLFQESTNFRKDKRATIRWKNGQWTVEFMGD